MLYKSSIKEYIPPTNVENAEIVSDRLMTISDEVVLRNRENYSLYTEGSTPTSVLYTGTGFKNTKTSSSDICKAQMCFIYIADLELVRYSKKEYPVYKIVNKPVYDGYMEGVPYEEPIYKDVLIDDDETWVDLDELDLEEIEC